MSIDLVIACINRVADWDYWLSPRNPLLMKPYLNALILVGSTHIACATRNGTDHLLTLADHCDEQREELANRPFNKAKMLRLGASCSNAETLMFIDCDLRIAPSMVRMLHQRCRFSKVQTCIYLERVVESSLELRHSKHSGLHPFYNRGISGHASITIKPWQTTGWRPGFGNVIVSRQLYQDVGMHDPSYTQYGWEDLDLLARLQLAGAEVHALGQACHLSHPDSMRCLNGMSRQQSTMIMRQVFLDKFRHLLNTNDADASCFPEPC